MSNIKVIFLDIDGVLNFLGSTHFKHGGVYGIVPQLLSYLNYIIEQTDAKIVVSSSWRLGGIGSDSSFYKEMLKRSRELNNYSAFNSVIGFTCDRNDAHRGKEILQWIEENNIKKFAILEDEPSGSGLYDIPLFTNCIFDTDMNIGLSAKIADSAINHLNK